jgi:peptide deformylase
LSVLSLIYAPHPVLDRPTTRISKIDFKINKLIDDMIETMHANDGVGLAANQIGVPLRIAVIQGPDDIKPLVLINPEIVKREGRRELTEGCLSIPGYQGEVGRSVTVKVKAINIDGRSFRIKAEDNLLAQALEHETDHLDGKLYVERLLGNDRLYKIKRDVINEGKRCNHDAISTESC